VGRGNYVPPVSNSSNAKYSCIYVDKRLVYGEEYWNLGSDFSEETDEFKQGLIYQFEERFKSFYRNNRQWLEDYRTRILAENNLCMLTFCDDDSYFAVSVIAKEDDNDHRILNLANRHLDNYAKALKDIVLDLYGEYRYRVDTYSSGIVRREKKVA
jgi:hypothetical protein